MISFCMNVANLFTNKLPTPAKGIHIIKGRKKMQRSTGINVVQFSDILFWLKFPKDNVLGIR